MVPSSCQSVINNSPCSSFHENELIPLTQYHQKQHRNYTNFTNNVVVENISNGTQLYHDKFHQKTERKPNTGTHYTSGGTSCCSNSIISLYQRATVELKSPIFSLCNLNHNDDKNNQLSFSKATMVASDFHDEDIRGSECCSSSSQNLEQTCNSRNHLLYTFIGFHLPISPTNQAEIIIPTQSDDSNTGTSNNHDENQTTASLPLYAYLIALFRILWLCTSIIMTINDFSIEEHQKQRHNHYPIFDSFSCMILSTFCNKKNHSILVEYFSHLTNFTMLLTILFQASTCVFTIYIIILHHIQSKLSCCHDENFEQPNKKQQQQQQQDHQVHSHRNEMPWFISFIWILYIITLTTELTVMLSYWTLLHNSGESLQIYNLYKHFIIGFLIWLDGNIISHIPIRFKQVYWVLLYGICYIGWSIIYECYKNGSILYPFLNWRDDPIQALVFSLIVEFVINPFVFTLCWLSSISIR